VRGGGKRGKKEREQHNGEEEKRKRGRKTINPSYSMEKSPISLIEKVGLKNAAPVEEEGGGERKVGAEAAQSHHNCIDVSPGGPPSPLH